MSGEPGLPAGRRIRPFAPDDLAALTRHLVAVATADRLPFSWTEGIVRDELLDYRARRPRMTFVLDHFESVEMPTLALYRVTDPTGQDFLLLSGPEPDYQWLRFLAAVDLLVERARLSPPLARSLSYASLAGGTVCDQSLTKLATKG